jgi:hypothetical protein
MFATAKIQICEQTIPGMLDSSFLMQAAAGSDNIVMPSAPPLGLVFWLLKVLDGLAGHFLSAVVRLRGTVGTWVYEMASKST